MELVIENEEQVITSHKAKRFLVWLFVGSSTIMFGGWTSYYLVFMASKGKGHGLVLPEAFQYSTLVLIASSILLFLAGKALKNNNIIKHRSLLILTFLFGVLFGVLQYYGWISLYRTGAVLVNNNAAISMIYIISGMHLLHILGGLIIISFGISGNISRLPMATLKFRQDVAAIFWHFIDLLWVYLYIFLLFSN